MRLIALLILLMGGLAIAQDKVSDEIVTYSITSPASVDAGDQFEVRVTFHVAETWYIYAPTGVNASQGMIETTVLLSPPSGLSKVDRLQLPKSHFKGGYEVYDGDSVTMVQTLKVSGQVNPGIYTVKCKIKYQSCSEDICLPPVTSEQTLNIEVKKR